MANKYLNDTGLQYFFNKLKTIFLTSVDYDSTNKKITKTLNGTTSDVVTLATMKTAMELNNVANGAEVNQNAFSNVKVGSTTVAADSKTDTLELVAGSNVTLTPDATNDKITIDASGAVESVAGKTGVVTLSKSDVGLGNVDNTADANKSVASAGKLTTAQNIEGVSFDGSANTSHYATCSTAAATAAKVATITPTKTFTLETGARVFVKFTNAINVASATLNVNGTGAKAIYYNGAALGKNLTDANGTYEFIYNGTQWELVGDLDTDTTYTAASANPLMDGTAAVGTSAKYAREDHVHPSDTTKSNKTETVSNIRLESQSGGGIKLYKTINGTESALNVTIPTYYAMTQTEYDTGTDIYGKLISPSLLKSIVTNAVAGVTQISYQVVTSLPATGETGVIYLIAHSHGTGDGYDEYIWLGSAYEKIGNTDVDLSGYLKTTDMVAITTSEIDTLFA